jgi:hypothetical protein
VSQGPDEEVPALLAAWIEGLTFGKKRTYAEAYARAMLSGSEPPVSPAFSRKDWPTRARKRVERLLRDSDVSTSADSVAAPPRHLDDDDVDDDDLDSDPHDPIAVDLFDPAVATSTVSQLVPGLSSIGDVAIPYGRLPRRAATRYEHEFKTWSQIGDVTIDELMSRRGAGVDTVTAILQVAVDAVRFPGSRPVTHSSDDNQPSVNIGPLGSALVLVGKWWSLFHDRPASLGELLELDRSQVPADVSSALAAIADFASPQQPTPITPSAAVHGLLDKVDDRERDVLIARLWSETPSTLDAIAGGIGVTRERVRQIQSKAEAKLRAFFAEAEDRSVAWYANELERRLGPYLPRQLADEVFRSLGVDVESLVARVLLHFAGPYAMGSNGWLENVGSSGAAIVAAAVDRVFDSCAKPNTASLMDALEQVGMGPEPAAHYLRTEASLKLFDDTWLRWRGTAVDKAHTVLELSGEPATAETINESIGEGHSVMTLKNGMSGDSRFVRTGKRTWGLRAWGVEEYSGIVEEILERVDAAGGTVRAEELIKELVSTFPDVAENSIKIYLGTLAFVVEGGTVRRRNDSDGWPEVGQFKDARGAFRRGDGEVRLAVNVTRDVLRGSGFAIHAAVAKALGTLPGGRRIFTSTEGAIATIGWRPWSTTGPDIGSVRAFATATAAQAGDTLVLVFNRDNNSVEAVKVPVEATGAARLAGLFGVDSNEDLEAILAAGLECRASEVRSVLRGRGEGDIAELIPVAADARLENEIASLIAELT